MTPLQIKLAIYAATGLILLGSYFAWAYHQRAIGAAEVRAEVAEQDAKTAKQSADLMARKKAEVEKSNKDKTERLLNAVQIYADQKTVSTERVTSLVERMQRSCPKAASGSRDSMPGRSDDNTEGKGRDHETNLDIARAANTLADLCEKKINELKVVN